MAVVVEDVLDAVADALHLSGGRTALAPWWAGVCARALGQAAHDVAGAFLLRGYTPDQVAAWPDLDAHTLTQALYWSLVMGGGLDNLDDKFVKLLDQREGLKTAALTDAAGALATAGVVGHGPLVWSAERGDSLRDLEGKLKPW